MLTQQQQKNIYIYTNKLEYITNACQIETHTFSLFSFDKTQKGTNLLKYWTNRQEVNMKTVFSEIKHGTCATWIVTQKNISSTHPSTVVAQSRKKSLDFFDRTKEWNDNQRWDPFCVVAVFFLSWFCRRFYRLKGQTQLNSSI